MKTLSNVFVALFILLFSPTVFGQINTSIDSITVSASRIPTSVAESGKSVTVLTSKELAKYSVSSLDEVLRFIPGVNVNTRQSFGVQTDFGMRGSTFSQVLVLVDGVRLNDPLTAHFNNNFPIPISEIEQVEIIRGPAAASFGADAVGGVIHVKTKTFLQKQDKKGFATTGRMHLGAHDLFDTDLGVTAYLNNVTLSAAVKVTTADGEELMNPNFNLGNGNTAADSLFSNFFDVKTYTVGLNYRPNEEWSVNSRVGLDRRDFAAKYFYTRSTFDESTEETESVWSQLSIARSKGKNTTELSGGFKTTDDFFAFNPLFSANEHTTDRIFLNLSNTHSFEAGSQLAVGVQYDDRTIESTDRGNHENYSAEGYVVLFHPLIENLNATLSTRAGYDDNYGSKFIPQLNLAYSTGALTLRTSGGRAVRAGDFTERFISSQIPNLSPGRNIGNPDLDSESSWTFDIGADWNSGAGTFLSSSIFYRSSENLIDYTFTNSDDIENVTNLQPNENYFFATNVSEATTLGVEILAQQQWNLTEKSSLKSQLGYTFLDTENDGDEVSKYLANHPKHNLNLLLALSGKHFSISSANNYINRDSEAVNAINAEVGSAYWVSHLNLGIRPNSDHLQLNFRLNNAFDTDYEEILGSKLPGRWFSAGVQWNLEK